MNNGCELYRKHRPADFKSVIGQDDAVRMLVDFGRRKAIPHVLMFSGPTGVGKTTLARILRCKMGCGDADFHGIDAAKTRGIDTIRDIEQRMWLAPMSGKCSVWLIDECHRLTGEAMDGLLEMLEDTPDHVYFMLATTRPEKVIRTIISRATPVRLQPLSPKHINELILRVADSEKIEISQAVADKLVDASQGSARQALVLLHAVAGLHGDDARLAVIASLDLEAQAIDLCRALLKPQAQWPDVAKILRGLEGEPEDIRRAVLGYARSVLVKGGGVMAQRAARIIELFQFDYFASGRAGLDLSCWNATL